jgi:hypothetical protein
MSDITHERLKQLFRYEPETGEFFGLSGKKKGPIGYPNHAGHIIISMKLQDEKKTCKKYSAHRLAWFYVHGSLPDGEIDHINGDRADNRIENLRIATRSENNANRKVNPRSSIKAKGVQKEKGSSAKYSALITVKGKTMYLGYFDSIDEAAHAYNKAAIQHFGDFACLNPIGVDKAESACNENGQRGSEA